MAQVIAVIAGLGIAAVLDPVQAVLFGIGVQFGTTERSAVAAPAARAEIRAGRHPGQTGTPLPRSNCNNRVSA